MEPREQVVAVAMGGSRQLTCRLDCAGRTAASVQWRGLDTSLGAVQSGAGSSVLSVRNASLSMAGTHVCVGSCGNLTYQQAVELLVFGQPPVPLPLPAFAYAVPPQQPFFVSVVMPPPPESFPRLPMPPPAQSLHCSS